MRTTLGFIVIALAAGGAFAKGSGHGGGHSSKGSNHASHSSGGAHSVKGYTKKNSTYVAPHRQTNSNKSKTDNWSSKGNTNPDTGKKGTVDPSKP